MRIYVNVRYEKNETEINSLISKFEPTMEICVDLFDEDGTLIDSDYCEIDIRELKHLLELV